MGGSLEFCITGHVVKSETLIALFGSILVTLNKTSSEAQTVRFLI